MKRLYRLLAIPLACCLSCINSSKGNLVNNAIKPDSTATAEVTATQKEVVRYRPVNRDTTVFLKDLSLYGKPCRLKILSYSMNDGGVSVKLKDSTVIIHNIAARIILTHKGIPVIDRIITKVNFKDSISSYTLRTSTLEDITFEFARTNRLYFKCWIANEAGKEEIKFAIFYQGPRKGELNYWKGLKVYY